MTATSLGTPSCIDAIASVHRGLRIWSESIRPHLQSVQCQYCEVRKSTSYRYRCLLTYRSLCPTNSSSSFEFGGVIPVAQSDVAGIPPIALTIPDFEGQAILRIFANSTQSEVGCFSASVTNGNTFAQPAAVGSILGIFTIIASVASFATSIYGDHIPTIRTHHAHSLSIFVVFSVLHHIFFTGALSMNWPSVLPAFWSNFAWSAGMIYTKSMQDSINKLIGTNKGNTTAVGAQSLGASSDNTGGGYSISQIYRRTLEGRSLVARDLENRTTGFSWYGNPVKPGLPLPGNYSGFAGTLSSENIPASNAFMTGFLWLLVLLVTVVGSVILFKWLLEASSRFKLIKSDRLLFFRKHWLGFTAMAAARIAFIGFFMMIFLTLFEFVYKGSPGVTALASLVFLVFFVGLISIAGYACFYRLRFGHFTANPDRIHLERTKALGCVPWLGVTRASHRSEKTNPKPSIGSLPWWTISYTDEDPQRLGVHEDEDFIKKFGWLSALFRKGRWWAFALWLVYEFVRACFYGGAAGRPLTQVFGLLVVEAIALITIIQLKPFEGSRLNTLMVYILGFSKVVVLALSAAFDARFSLPRIITTAIGVVIIVIQGILTIILLIAIVVGVVSSHMSLTRNREDYRPRHWARYRERYFAHINRAATDRPPTPPPMPEEPKEPYFNMHSVRRVPKIEDEDENNIGDRDGTNDSRISVAAGGTTAAAANRGSRADSLRSTMSYSNLPYGAKPHRASWSSRDFHNWHELGNRESGTMSRGGTSDMQSNISLREFSPRSRAPSRGNSLPLEVRKSRNNGKEKERDVTAE